jgi:2-dehydro-3-deoxygalactonokinase
MVPEGEAGARWIAVDWGSSNRRVYAVDANGHCLGFWADAHGVLATAPGDFPAEAAAIRARSGDHVLLLAGMIGSDRGWTGVPYVQVPARLEQVAAALVWVEPGRTGIVPGVSQPAPHDVMRGEEVQILGAVHAGLAPPDGLICHPGTHAKWITVEGGAIARFTTMMTGELFALLQRHSVLAPQMKGDAADGPAFRRGVEIALSGVAPQSALFGIRARHVLGQDDGDGASFASGILIGSEVAAGLRQAGGGEVTVIGRGDLAALYAVALTMAGRESRTVDGSAAFLAGMTVIRDNAQ